MSAAVGILTLLFGLVVVWVVAARNRAVAAPLLVGYCIRGLAAVVDVHFVRLLSAHDGHGWDRVAAYWAQGGFVSTFEHIETGHNLYVWMMSAIYSLLGHDPLIVQSLNVLFGTLIVKNVWDLANLLSRDAKLARRAAWITAVFPSLIIYSALLLREIATAYPLTLGVLLLVRWFQTKRVANVVGAAVAIIVSMAFHSGGLAVLLAAGVWFVGGWFRNVLTGNYANFGRNTLALIAGVAAVAFVLLSGFGMEKFQHMDPGDVSTITETQNIYTKGRTAYLEDLRAESPADLIWQAPIRLVYFLFAPFPWMMSTFSDAFGVLDSLFYLWLAWIIFRQRRTVRQNRSAMLVLAVFAAMAVVFAIGVSNYGTAMRHRNKMMPLLVAVSMSLTANKKRARAALDRPRSGLSVGAPAPRV